MRQKTITCPNCGAEYLPVEIFLRDSLLGYPTKIEKDENLKILTTQGKQPDLEETYICDKCDKTLKIKAKLDFETSILETQEEYMTKREPKLILKEN